jgi:hypothetical protein
MGRRYAVRHIAGFVLFDVLHEDGAHSSNRKVPCAELAGIDKDLAARTYIEAQDGKIANFSGKPRNPIKSVARLRRRSGLRS